MAEFDRADTGTRQVEARARWLGYLGLVPFIALSLWLYGIADDHPWRAITISLLIGYSATTLSFLGGIRWGQALRGRDGDARRLAVSLVPALLAWASPLVLPPYCFAVLAVAFAAQGAWDSSSVGDGGVPDWFGRQRIRLTIVVVLTMVLAFFATA